MVTEKATLHFLKRPKSYGNGNNGANLVLFSALSG